MRRARSSTALLMGLLSTACTVSTVDLGSNQADVERDAGTKDPLPDAGDPGPVTTSVCPAVTEEEVEQLYGFPCVSSCATGEGSARSVGSAAEQFSVMATQWQTCEGEVPWASDVIGMEVQAGCTLFLLHRASNGDVVRGVDSSDQGTFDIVETRLGDAVIDRSIHLHLPSFDGVVKVVTSDCPHSMVITKLDGSLIRFAAIPSKSPPIN